MPCGCVARCCRSPTRPASSTSRAAWSSSASSSSRPAAPPASSPAPGCRCAQIEDFTGFPEMMDGRVKTLHPRLYAGLLALRDDDEHLRAAAEHGIEPVDLVCVNLYPFERTIARGDATAGRGDREHRHRRSDDDPRGRQEQRLRRRRRGPRRLRAACSPSCASPTGGSRCPPASASPRPPSPAPPATTPRSPRGSPTTPTLAPMRSERGRPAAPEGFPVRRTDVYVKQRELRYGENPHQRGAYYARAGAPTHLLAGVRQLHGKELSFNNLLDLSSARELAEEFAEPACAIVKHNNPCGCALGESAPDRLRTGLRVRPPERLRRRDRAQPSGRPRLRRGARRAVHRGPARSRLRPRCARGAAGQEERAPARAARLPRTPAAMAPATAHALPPNPPSKPSR